MDRTFLLIIGTVVMTMSFVTLLIFVILYQRKVSKKNNLINQVRESLNKSEMQASQRFIEGQQEEKRKIAKELHDNIGSELTMLKLKSGGGEKDIEHKIDHILSQVRSISHELNKSEFTYENLEKRLRNYIHEVSSHSNLLIEFEAYGLHDIIEDKIGRNVYRIVQELIQNTVKHARATKIYLEINHYAGQALNIMYEDNGIGLRQTAHNQANRGIGLTNMKERVADMNGEIKIIDREKGFELLIDCEF